MNTTARFNDPTEIFECQSPSAPSNISVSNWSVLRECGQEPLQFYWFRAAVRFYNALLCSDSSTLAKVLKADIAMSAINKKCWSAEFLDALHGLERSGDFQHRVRTF